MNKEGVIKRYLERFSGAIRVAWLPTYAPELNPVEQVWNHSKYADLANLAANDLEELESLVKHSITKTKNKSHLIKSFFKKAGLPIQ